MLTQRLTSSLLRASCTVTRQVRASISPSSFSIFASASVSARNASSLVYIEHRDGVLNDSTLHAVSAAQKADSTAKQGVDALIVGTPSEVASVVPQVSKIAGLSKIYTAKNEAYAHGMAETIAPVVTRFLTSSTPGAEIKHLFAAHTAVGKNLFPRVSGLLDVSMIADIIDVSYDPAADVTEFSRPIYAGNAVVRVKTDGKLDKIRVVTVRTTAFDKAVQEGGEAVEEDIEAVVEESPSKFISEELTQSSRPDLSSASRVVSGGRALKSMESFNEIMEPLADSLGAAIGASRAAVDAGYADNSLQVGQTGKVVAPELYVAIGISGAIQHLAGMKESKLIVAINKDADAPIFQVADVGLVADLFNAVPELTEKIKANK